MKKQKESKLKMVLVLLILISSISIYGQQTEFKFKDKIIIENVPHLEIFKRAINWHTGARRTILIEKVFSSESKVISSNKTITYTNKTTSFLQTSLNIIVSKPHRSIVSYTVKLEITDGKCEYTIDNFYYKIDMDKKGACFQYINILNKPPTDCKSLWGLAFYKNTNINIQKITKDYIENYLIPELKIWLNKK